MATRSLITRKGHPRTQAAVHLVMRDAVLDDHLHTKNNFLVRGCHRPIPGLSLITWFQRFLSSTEIYVVPK